MFCTYNIIILFVMSSFLLALSSTVACMKRWGLRAAILSSYTELDAG
jgi:hypothetical protein